MRANPAVLTIEAQLTTWFAGTSRWVIWTAQGDKRRAGTPSLLALHTPTRQLLAVHGRPRQLHPSERPPVDRFPDGVTHVIWHPGLKSDARRWIDLPATPPPGHLAGDWRTSR